jgi:hypothetical protein
MVKHSSGAAKPFRKLQIHGTIRCAYGGVRELLRLSPLENHRYTDTQKTWLAPRQPRDFHGKPPRGLRTVIARRAEFPVNDNNQ